MNRNQQTAGTVGTGTVTGGELEQLNNGWGLEVTKRGMIWGLFIDGAGYLFCCSLIMLMPYGSLRLLTTAMLPLLSSFPYYNTLINRDEQHTSSSKIKPIHLKITLIGLLSRIFSLRRLFSDIKWKGLFDTQADFIYFNYCADFHYACEIFNSDFGELLEFWIWIVDFSGWFQDWGTFLQMGIGAVFSFWFVSGW